MDEIVAANRVPFVCPHTKKIADGIEYGSRHCDERQHDANQDSHQNGACPLVSVVVMMAVIAIGIGETVSVISHIVE